MGIIITEECKVSFTDAIGDTTGIVDYIPSYLGPSMVVSKQGFSHIWGALFSCIQVGFLVLCGTLSFVDDINWRAWVYTMKHNSKVMKIFMKWRLWSRCRQVGWDPTKKKKCVFVHVVQHWLRRDKSGWHSKHTVISLATHIHQLSYLRFHWDMASLFRHRGIR